MICSAPFASAIKPASAILGAVKVLFVRVSVDVLAPSVSAPEGIVTVPPFVMVAIVGAVKLNCEQNTHGQTLMGQPHSASDSGFFMLPLDGGSARATPNVLLSGAKTIATVQALSGAGAVSLNTLHTQLTTTGAQAQTLANGVNGQIKIITMVADGGDGTLTPATFANGSTITFNDVGDSVLLIYNTTGGWALVSNTGCTIA